MSGVAGIIYWNGHPVDPGQMESMTAAMKHRGPDGISHWRRESVALGQCMLRTTKESLSEHLPLENDDGSLVLVMDGRVDNCDELRRKLLGRGVELRSVADAELVLRAYEVWGEDCVHHIVGECVFFVWNARDRRLFATRDAAGTRHFYFHQGDGWFAFASEIKGLLALPQTPRRLNEKRVLDYLVSTYERDDQVSTFYQSICRLPAGHSMTVDGNGHRTWRWWRPDQLTGLDFKSLEACAEAFAEEMVTALRSRVRSDGRGHSIGAMLSGGMDSSSLVGLLQDRLRTELPMDLRVFTLTDDVSGHCPDLPHAAAVVNQFPWLKHEVLATSSVDLVWQRLVDGLERSDEPFDLSHGLTYGLVYQRASQTGCNSVIDGMAGDMLFYDPVTTAEELLRRGHLHRIPALVQMLRLHGAKAPVKRLLRAGITAWGSHLPEAIKQTLRPGLRRRELAGNGTAAMLKSQVLNQYLDDVLRHKHSRVSEGNERQRQSRRFTSGLLSFAHENYGLLAFQHGVEPRSPFSDRRLIEFGLRMPMSAKLALPTYKHLLRKVAHDRLPPDVVNRQDIAGHPGWSFFDQLSRNWLQSDSYALPTARIPLKVTSMLSGDALIPPWRRSGAQCSYDECSNYLSLAILSTWLTAKFPSDPW